LADDDQGLWFVIARSNDNNGNATGSYAMVWAGGNQVTKGSFQTVFNTTIGGVTVQDTSAQFIAALPYFTGTNNYSGAYGGTTMVSPIVQNVGGVSNPVPDFLCGSCKDFPNNTTAQITVYGITSTYICFYSGSTMPGAGAAQSNYVSLLFLYQ
jgi:hypothetical protein